MDYSQALSVCPSPLCTLLAICAIFHSNRPALPSPLPTRDPFAFAGIRAVPRGQAGRRRRQRTGPRKMTDGRVVLSALKMHQGSCRRANLSSTLCQQALQSALPLCPLCQLSSGQEMRFLAIRQSDFLLSSVSSSPFSCEEPLSSLALSAAGSVRQGKLWHPQSANVGSFSGDFPRFRRVLASSVSLCD